MRSLLPSYTALPNSSETRELPSDSQVRTPSGREYRLWVFALVLVPALAGSLLYVWLREPVYQATASVLTVAPAAIDEA